MMFTLHQRLAEDTLFIGQFPLCEALLMNDARYPWIILVPKRSDITEIHQLSIDDQQQLMQESCFVASKLADLVNADKMNIAALGNVVSQLHVHHVARFVEDETWPNPIWGRGQAIPYSEEESAIMLMELRAAFIDLLDDGN